MEHDAIYTTSAVSLFLEHAFARLLPNMVRCTQLFTAAWNVWGARSLVHVILMEV